MSIVKDVVFFNQEVLGIEQRTPGILPTDEHEITIKCLHEEIDEYIDAYDECCRDDDAIAKDHELKYVADMADAMIDNIYFAIGALYKLGLTADQIERGFSAVHNCNVQKKAGQNAKRATGAADAVKPEGWVGPEQKLLEIIKERVE